MSTEKQPMSGVEQLSPEKILECFFEIEALTRLKRAGWVLAGVPEPESVSDHCFQTAVFAFLLAQYSQQKFDIGKVLTMALFHEIGEARITDLPRRSKDYIGKARKIAEFEAAKDILHVFAPSVLPALEEMHELNTPEARIVEAAEELQIIFKALVYAKEGRGDMTEYRIDVKKYDPLGSEIASRIRDKIEELLYKYLGEKPYFPVGYSKSAK